MINETTSATEGTQVSVCSLATVAMNARLALDVQHSGQGSDCARVHAINASGQEGRSIKNVKKNPLMVFFRYSGPQPWGYV